MNRLYKDISIRGSGKSTRLLKKAVAEGCDIATFNSRAVKTFVDIAISLGIDPTWDGHHTAHVGKVLVAPITDFAQNNANADILARHRPVLVDEIGLSMSTLLGGIRLSGYTESVEELGCKDDGN